MGDISHASMVVLVLLVTAAVVRAAAPPATMPSPEAFPAVRQLPDPFTFTDGSRVRDRADWERRRQEIREIFQASEYGHLPPTPERMTVESEAAVEDVAAGATRQTHHLTLHHGDRQMTIGLRVTTPRGSGLHPVVLRGTFGRRPATRATTAPATRAAAATTAAATTRPGFRDTTPLFLARGYAVAEFPFSDVAQDRRDHPRGAGVYALFGDDDLDAGTLMAWAWGLSRVIDALPQVDGVDPNRVVVTGHSRFGKAALLAGAFDDRISITVPSHSGAGGAAPYRFLYGKSEAIENITGAFPHWFRPGFERFVGRVERLPVDQHLLHALVAPRALLMTEGTEDAWTNPQGSQLTYLAGREAYAYLGAPDRIAIRFRPVGHVPSDEDLLDFADHVFFAKPLPSAFNQLPYPEEPDGFSWRAPAPR